jgi:hypothetical protein
MRRWVEKRDPVGVPLPTSDQKCGFNLISGVLVTPPRFFSRVKLQSSRRVLRDLFQMGATHLSFSTSNSTYVLMKNQEVRRDSVRSSEHLFTGIQMKYQFIEQNKQEFPVVVMCRVLEVSESGFYTWRKRPTCRRRREDAQLTCHIRQVFCSHRERYGSPRIHADLHEQGIRCSRKRIARLMREAGMSAKRKRRRVVTTKRDATHPVAPNLLKREFVATEPNKKWVTDITYVPTAQGWL